MGRALGPQRPVRILSEDLRVSEALVIAVVPFARLGSMAACGSRQAAVSRARSMGDEDEGEGRPAEIGADGGGVNLAGGGEDIGAALWAPEGSIRSRRGGSARFA